MTTTTLTQSPSTASRRAPYGLLLVAIAISLVAAITITVIVLVTRTVTGPSSPGGGPGGQDNSGCRPTSVVHYC
jgi:hypothetical protein